MLASQTAREWLGKPIGYQYEGEPPSTWKAEQYELTGPVIIGYPKRTETTAAREAIRARIPEDVDCHWLNIPMLTALRRYNTQRVEREQWWTND